MNTTRSLGTVLSVFALLTLILSGCYTQMETTRDGQYSDEYYSSESGTTAVDSSKSEIVIDNYYNDGYGYGWYPSYRFGLSYYYPYSHWPSYGFLSAYYNPWYNNHHWDYPYFGYYSGHYYYPYYDDYGYGYTNTDRPSVRRGIRDYGLTRERGEKRRSVNTDRNNESISGRKSMSSRKIKVSQRTIDRQHLRNGSHAERSDKPSSSYQPNRRMSRSSSSGSIRSNSNGGRLDRSFQNHGRSYVPTTRPSRSSFSAPRSSSGFRGGGFGGGSRSSGGGSRGVGSRGGRR